MNCIVTAGPTYENLDEVRRLTNFSTGKLGTKLAACLSRQGHHVVLLRGYYAVYRGLEIAAESATFTTTADLKDRLACLASRPIDAIFHAAAVSDFGFGQAFARSDGGELLAVKAGKLSTRQGPLLVELVPTPKIIAELRGWFPRACLVGWKFEVDGTRDDAVTAGRNQIKACRTNACVVNGPAYGPGFGLVSERERCVHLVDEQTLFAALGEWISGTLPLTKG